MSWRDLVERTMKVPHAPDPPPGGGTPLVFRAAPNFYRLRQIQWLGRQVSALVGLMFGLMVLRRISASADIPELVKSLVLWAEILAWIFYVLQLPFSWMVMRLEYELRWYIVTDRSLRIREGILRVREKTMAFANIQNIAIRQGPLQRLLSIADVEVRNAGGGGSEAQQQGKGAVEPMHVGYFRGVENAAAIRDLLRAGVRRQKDAGLGDPDEEAETRDPGSAIDSAKEILENIRAARLAIQSGTSANA